jgi:tRNA(Ile2) C34 agmatinyltransferase TiaS
MAGTSCPECGGQVRNAGGTDYECRDCGNEFDDADLFLP